MKKRVAAVSLAAVLAVSGSAVGLADALVNKPAVDVSEIALDERISILPYIPVSENTVEANAKEDEKVMLERLILFVKENVRDTDDYEDFSYNTYLNSYGNTVFSLSWNSDSDGYSYMYVTIDSSEFLQSYYIYDDDRYDSQTQKKIEIPEFTKNDAVNAAVEFVKKVAPEYEVSADFADIYVKRYYSSPSYAVSLYRVIDGVRVEGESVYIDVNSKGEITSYSNYGTKNISYEAVKDIADYDSVVNSFKESNPLELKYITSYNYDTGKNTIRLAYVTPDSGSKVVDAVTGKAYTLEYKDVDSVAGDQFNTAAEAGAPQAEMSDSVAEEKSLSSVERAAVDNHTNFLNADDIKAVLMKYKDLGFDESYSLTSSYLGSYESSYSDKTIHYINLSFMSKSDSGNSYVYVTANAETGEITSYSYSDYEYPVVPYAAEEKAELYKTYTSREAAVESVEKLLGEMYGSKFDEFELQDSTWNESDSYGYLSYGRYVNGIRFDEDQIGVSFNRYTGKLSSIYFNYSDDAVFPEAGKTITASEAIDKLFAEFPLNAYYRVYIELDEENEVMYYTYNTEVDNKLALVYSYNEMASVVVDAVSGELYYRWGSGKATYTPTEYFNPNTLDVIKNHKAAEQIAAVYNLGAIEIGKDFNADAQITVSEFESILSAVINSDKYYAYPVSEDSAETAADMGNKAMTREEAAVKVVDMLGYGDIAKINDIFKEVDGIDANLMGYYAIANSLGLFYNVSDDTADGKLTYAGACCFIYNYILYTNAEG